MRLFLASFAVSLGLMNSAHAAEIGSFTSVIEKFEAAYPCSSRKITPAMDPYGKLYGCVDGKAQTAKLFINEAIKTGMVSNIKLVWNDWFKDQGYGVDADKAEALRMLRFLTSEYVSEKAPDLIKAFEGSSSSSFDVKGLRISYRYTRGSAIDERVMVIAPAQ